MKLYDEQAWMYDAAFSWDVDAEVAWLRERLGPDVETVLEPACGSARLWPAFARRGVEMAGIDRSRAMLDSARARMRDAGFEPPLLAQGELSSFEIGRVFDGAICPLGSFGYLTAETAAPEHLACVARHLRPGAHYLVQLELR